MSADRMPTTSDGMGSKMPTKEGFSVLAPADAESGELISLVLDQIGAFPAVQRLKAHALALLDPRTGDRLLDVGCGTGEDVRTLAMSVGASGSVIGVDSSPALVDVARKRSEGRHLPVSFMVGEAGALDLDDAVMDGVRCERVFQHLTDPFAAMAELVRVTKPGGRIVVIDTDWDLHAVHGADPAVSRRMLEAWSDSFANGRSARQLPGLFAAAGMGRPAIVSETLTVTDGYRAAQAPFPVMAITAQRNGRVAPAEARRWLTDLVEAGRKGTFFWSVTMFAVGATRP